MTEHSRLRSNREFDLITRIAQSTADHHDLLVGIGDDCAVFANGMVVSVDTSVEGVHFRRDWLSSEEIGYRAAAVAISDLAAMAAQPTALLVALTLPPSDYAEAALAISHGIAACARSVDAVIAGGDTTRTDGPLSISITVFGHAETPVRRSGAQPGDALWLTGRLGGAAAAVRAWLDGSVPADHHAAIFRRPPNRVAAARWLREHVPLHAMIDLSDGLAGDAGHLAAASNVGIVIEAERVPVSDAVDVQLALTGGDDYELCFAAPFDPVCQIVREFTQKFGVELTRVGTVTNERDVVVTDAGGHRMNLNYGYDHFEVTPP